MRDASFARAVCRTLSPDCLRRSCNRTSASPAATSIVPATACTRCGSTNGCARLHAAASGAGGESVPSLRAGRGAAACSRAHACGASSASRAWCKTEIHERFGLPRERLPVIYNAIDPAVFNPGLAPPSRRRSSRADIAADACVFLLVGSEYARKGVGRAHRSAGRACRRRRTCWWWDATGIQRATWRWRSTAASHARVTFAGAQTDPQPFYGAADAFVLPTLYDALSNAVLEALACGLPVITSDRCGAGELVRRPRRRNRIARRATSVPSPPAHAGPLLDRRPSSRPAPARWRRWPTLTPAAMAARLVELYECAAADACAGAGGRADGLYFTAALYCGAHARSCPAGVLQWRAGFLSLPCRTRDDGPPRSTPVCCATSGPTAGRSALAVVGMVIVAAGDLMLAWLVIPIVRNFESPDPARDAVAAADHRRRVPAARRGRVHLRVRHGLDRLSRRVRPAPRPHRQAAQASHAVLRHACGRDDPVEDLVRRASARVGGIGRHHQRHPLHADHHRQLRLPDVAQLEADAADVHRGPDRGRRHPLLQSAAAPDRARHPGPRRTR